MFIQNYKFNSRWVRGTSITPHISLLVFVFMLYLYIVCRYGSCSFTLKLCILILFWISFAILLRLRCCVVYVVVCLLHQTLHLENHIYQQLCSESVPRLFVCLCWWLLLVLRGRECNMRCLLWEEEKEEGIVGTT